VLLSAVHVRTSESRKVWSLTALSFGTAHFLLIGSLYFAQVSILLPALRNGNWEGLDQLSFANPRSVAWGLNHFAWSLLGVAMLAMAPVFEDTGRGRWIRGLLVLNEAANASLIPAFAFELTALTLVVAAVSWVMALPAWALVIALEFRDILANERQR
jgi:hypothetical protein